MRPNRAHRRAAVTLGLACFWVTAARAQNSPLCADQVPAPIISKPSIFGNVPGAIPQDAEFDCLMWQTFIYLNWPVTSNQRGVPNAGAAFGSLGQTVWESFKSVDDTFPPNGQNPGQWNTLLATPKYLTTTQRRSVASGNLRILRQTSKVSGALQSNPPPRLSQNQQVGNGILVDQNGQDVYYEMALNQTEFNYIVGNGLYEATAQYACSQTQGISLPLGSSAPQDSGAIEVKAAWKVLSPAELNANPVRFHTAQALLGNSTNSVTVGLVGLHIAQRLATMYQLVWATFFQVDNAPPIGNPPTSGNFSFFKVGCTTCQVNQKSAPNPTQVMQTSNPPSLAAKVNTAMQTLIGKNNPNSPWQFYQLISAQWPTQATALPTPPVAAGTNSPPLGSPNTNTLLNPVLETFFQGQTLSCLGCHQSATAANPQKGANQYPSSYSFAFAHASAAPNAKSVCPSSARPNAKKQR